MLTSSQTAVYHYFSKHLVWFHSVSNIYLSRSSHLFITIQVPPYIFLLLEYPVLFKNTAHDELKKVCKWYSLFILKSVQLIPAKMCNVMDG